MSIINVYIIEDNKKTCDEYIEAAYNFQNIKIAGYTSHSSQALHDIKHLKPEAILLDLELQEGSGSGIEFLIKLNKLRNYQKPYILVCTNNISHSTQDMIRKYGADYIISKQQQDFSASLPFNFLDMISESIHEAMHPDSFPVILDINDDMKLQLIQKELYNLGFNPKHKGYKYLTEGIFLLLTTEHEKISEICNALAIKYNTKPSNIEHGMQNAIKFCWLHGDIDIIYENYTAIIDAKRTVPTIKEFIEFYKNKFKTHEYFTY